MSSYNYAKLWFSLVYKTLALNLYHMCHLIRKPIICILENNDATSHLSVTVQPDLFRTCLETMLVFSQDGPYMENQ